MPPDDGRGADLPFPELVEGPVSPLGTLGPGIPPTTGGAPISIQIDVTPSGYPPEIWANRIAKARSRALTQLVED